ncbi:MAG TPA: nitroreductase family protein [Candidatus Krumholzibacteria bacterium]|nr:nitroreductase family protein [Candidatus Krumholzibacteria bacterium]HPD70346.1 nitroreductase family protein [Candidatus Krumholzibacteria bacterium]HRY39954.1 nitroreductase family protein [Candidatus Krumholzibacteria bacterium]
MLHDLVRRCRSYRRFRAGRAVSTATLRRLVDLARLSASAGNKQPIRFLLSSTHERNALIFPHLRWAGYLTDWPGPPPHERPSAYLVILGDNEVTTSVRWDDAICAWSVLLGATEQGLGGCMIAAFDRPGLRAALAIPDRYEPLLVVALGEPLETVMIDEVGDDGDIRYWRDPQHVHHVPKRRLDDLIVDFD